jgi:hypothetical protein
MNETTSSSSVFKKQEGRVDVAGQPNAVVVIEWRGPEWSPLSLCATCGHRG